MIIHQIEIDDENLQVLLGSLKDAASLYHALCSNSHLPIVFPTKPKTTEQERFEAIEALIANIKDQIGE